MPAQFENQLTEIRSLLERSNPSLYKQYLVALSNLFIVKVSLSLLQYAIGNCFENCNALGKDPKK